VPHFAGSVTTSGLDIRFGNVLPVVEKPNAPNADLALVKVGFRFRSAEQSEHPGPGGKGASRGKAGGRIGGMRLGIAHHLGWAVAVMASAEHKVVDRRRIELIEPGLPTAPIHHEGGPYLLHRRRNLSTTRLSRCW
jgi:hypothetical protein